MGTDAVDVIAFATQGGRSNDGDRIAALLEPLAPSIHAFDRSSKAGSAVRLWRDIARRRPDAVVMEGTGIAGGVAMILTAALLRVPYVVSSGDAVTPFIASKHPALRPFAALYERLLYRRSAGFIGWTPYLAGRALTLGAPRAMTAASWTPFDPPAAEDGARVRRDLGIPEGAVVFGIVGSLDWNPRVGYAYGLELVRAVREVAREDVRVLVVGDGSGRARLAEEAGGDARVLLPGRIERTEVPAYLRAMDVGSLPQSVDGVGAFRYTTKISEYLAAGLPIVTGRLPLAYDLELPRAWRLPGHAPWDPAYITALAELMQTYDATSPRPEATTGPGGIFDKRRQQEQVAAFVTELVQDRRRARGGDR